MMIMNLQYVLLVALLLPIVFCPGPMNMFCMSQGIRMGKINPYPAILGGISAYGLQIIIILYGSGMVKTDTLNIKMLSFAGISYLGYLGIKYLFWQALAVEDKLHRPVNSAIKIYLTGLLITFTNPKNIIVYTAIFPRFVALATDNRSSFSVIYCIFVCLFIMSAFCYILLGNKLFLWVQHRQKEKLFFQSVGVILLFIAAVLSYLNIN